jgi:hypothetical protein
MKILPPLNKTLLLALACALLPPVLAHAEDAQRCTYVEVADMPLKYAGPRAWCPRSMAWSTACRP